MELLVLTVASLFAGFVDSIVGGGGLILIPALFAVFPTAHPATLFGTNKGASVWGTGFATWRYSRQVDMRWQALLPAAGAGLVASFAGAWLVTVVSPEFLRKALPFVLTLVLLYTLAKKDLGRHHTPHYSDAQEAWVAAAHHEQVAVQHPVAYRAAGKDRRGKSVLRAERFESQSAGQNLLVGRGHKQLAGIARVQRVAAIGIDDQYAPTGVACFRCGQH